MKIEKRWIVSFSVVSLVALLGMFWPKEVQTAKIAAQFGTISQLNFADVAWMLTASCLVLLMTPGLSFFMVVWLEKKCNFNNAPKFYLFRCSYFNLGSCRI